MLLLFHRQMIVVSAILIFKFMRMNIEVKLVIKLPAYKHAEEKHWALPEELIRRDPRNNSLSPLHQYDHGTTGFSKITTSQSDTRQPVYLGKVPTNTKPDRHHQPAPRPSTTGDHWTSHAGRGPLLQSSPQWPMELNLTNEEVKSPSVLLLSR